jgi:hypothetical protein
MLCSTKERQRVEMTIAVMLSERCELTWLFVGEWDWEGSVSQREWPEVVQFASGCGSCVLW